VTQPLARAWVKQPPVKILVVVANIQMRTLKAEVEKGSMWTAVGHGLVDPKPQGNSVRKGALTGSPQAKGNRVNIPEPERGYWLRGLRGSRLHLRQRKRTQGRRRWPREEFSFLVNSHERWRPWNLFARRYGRAAGKALHFMSSPVRRRRPLKTWGREWFSRPFVLITAAGLQGEQPLAHRTM